MKERIYLLREKEKEIKDLWNGLYMRDLKHYIETQDKNWKEYIKETVSGVFFVLFLSLLFYLFWFILP